MNFDGLKEAVIKMLGNGRCVIDPTTFQNEEFLRAINVSGWSGLIQALEQSETLLKDTWKMNNKAVSAEISAIHDQTVSMTRIGNRA